jgi:isopenicillin-N epimerase
MHAHFLLDPEVAFLNHGSFGATPKEVFAVYQDWQRRLERQPVAFLGRSFQSYMQTARDTLANFLGAPLDTVAFVPNATWGVNVVARSLELGPGDEVLTTDHEYGAIDKTWEFVCERSGFRIIRARIPIPIEDDETILARIWECVTPRTKLISISHITSPTALVLPVRAVCERARHAGILTLVDGAHAPGQLDLDLANIGADFYTGNCHKWLLAPKGAGFLYARLEVQDLIQPLVVSWGWRPAPEFSSGSAFIDALEWTGTRDYSAYLSVPAAIRFLEENDWPERRRACHTLLSEAIARVCALSGLPDPYAARDDAFLQMGIAPIPLSGDRRLAQAWLYENHRVEVPFTESNGDRFARISVQAYNSPEDIDRLVQGLKELLDL